MTDRGSAVAEEPALRVAAALRDRREAALLALPSVRRTAELLAQRCREPSWVRTAVTTLDRFRVLAGVEDLEGLLAEARRDSSVADAAMRRFLAALDGHAPEHVAGLAFGAKVWWRTNGVPVPWRPLTAGAGQAAPASLRDASGLPTLGLIGSGLTAEELATVRVGDLGSLDEQGALLPDPFAEPLAVSYRGAGDGQRWITFLSPAASVAVLARLAQLGGAGLADPAASLVRPEDLDAARERNVRLIGAGNDVNVALCRATGDFFRSWGMPGARYEQRRETYVPARDPYPSPERRPR